MSRQTGTRDLTDEAKQLLPLWSSEGDFSRPDIKITRRGDTIYVEVENMYEYVTVGFKQLIGLAKFFQTDRFTIDEHSFSGCETCDYGSSYTKTFTCQVKDVGVWDAPGIREAEV